ncbi:alpha/beta hydrolase [Polycladidibacter hongkongensis]|uniref:alpha/beta hydrolase n=1 Tax=Polycladidibacter hongkongensis TaxID=1647556 RepID=UPI0008329939|nr:alpha/beta hydrolase [Pseudovibrio hongkongensis]
MHRSAGVRDWDAAYYNTGVVPQAPEIFKVWYQKADAFRVELAAQGRARLDIPYNAKQQLDADGQTRCAYDLFLPAIAQPKGLVTFVHGGYWMAFDRKGSSHLAAGALAHGYAVAMPGYQLCPQVSITTITHQVRQSICHAASTIAGPIFLTGHSAGGHLVAQLLCKDHALPQSLASRLCHVLGISGVYDLRPLTRTKMNETLRLTFEDTQTQSPLLQEPLEHSNFTAWVGAEELPEFLRQSRALYQVWGGSELDVSFYAAPDKHHFNVVDDLSDPDSKQIAQLLQL